MRPSSSDGTSLKTISEHVASLYRIVFNIFRHQLGFGWIFRGLDHTDNEYGLAWFFFLDRYDNKFILPGSWMVALDWVDYCGLGLGW